MNIFVWCVAAILLVTCLAKLLSIAANSAILLAQEPLTGLSYRTALLVEAVVELIAAGFLLFWRSARLCLLIVFWLGTSFTVYHVALLLLDPAAPCACLGTLYGKLGLAQRYLNFVAWAIASCLVGGPIVIWMLEGRIVSTKPTGECSGPKVI